ncbi:MAG TPA: PadR family transcriptional regulator [Candidatus Flavonifractor merdigallinarum]|uniref:PadR family transcriptional regulator n=1 Tax=Candidatus Flavonifractor merdigallinarum TaxID=2838589 RepID=A0A9D1Y9S3_9FIRM|nr:PadR family transcriptional regulator [Candidatus Flavonifractor merdigallinarum]
MAKERSAPGGLGMLLLSLLSEQDRYGYELIETLRSRSNHVFDLKAGTLYPLLHTLERQNWVTSYDENAPGGRARRYYHITEDGRRALSEQREQWHSYTAAVEGVLEGGVLCGA